jgi:hypothetical protein
VRPEYGSIFEVRRLFVYFSRAGRGGDDDILPLPKSSQRLELKIVQPKLEERLEVEVKKHDGEADETHDNVVMKFIALKQTSLNKQPRKFVLQLV